MDSFRQIAIIGMSGRFPEASSMDEVDEILTKRIDIIKPVSNKRMELQKLDKSVKYKKSAYLDNIEYFDYPFFNMSKNEAMYMDPQHRICLELACDAINNSGYSLDSLNGTNTSVFIGAHDSHYIDMIDNPSGTALVGNFLDTLPARISYFLNLQGEASLIRTACSSGLTCVYDACIKLNSFETDLALAGAVTIDFNIRKEDDEDKIGIISNGDKCKTFDEDADGTNFGEGAGFLVLKRYEDAKKDGDNILAIIKSIGVNQDGARSNSLSAPSVNAQAELLEKTWKKGNIDPLEIGYIEAHGTGTKIGDPIEISGITKAVRKFTDKKQYIPIGSIKTNYTHMGAFSGIANVIKGILSFKYNKKYPLDNFKESNKLIDFNSSPVYPLTKVENWDNNKEKLYATSSFGISGTNVHLVLEEEKDKDVNTENAEEIVMISLKYPELIEEYKNNLLKDIKANNYESSCYTLNVGRNQYEYRKAAVVKSKDELINFIGSINELKKDENKYNFIFLCSSNNLLSEQEMTELINSNPYIKKQYEYYYEKAKNYSSNENIEYLIQNICLFDYFKFIGIKVQTVIGNGRGNIVVSYLTDEKSLEDTLKIMESCNEDDSFNELGFKNYINSIVKNEKYFFIELGANGHMSNVVNSISETDIVTLTNNKIKEIIVKLIIKGININWENYYYGKKIKRAALASVPFRKLTAWPSTIKSNETYKLEGDNKGIDKEKLSIHDFLCKLWCQELGEDEIDDDEDLFDLGADSLMGMNIIDSIYKEIGIKIDFDAIYKYPTIAEEEKYLKSLTEEKAKECDNDNIIKYIDRKEHMKVSYNQKRILYLFENSKDSAAYNMPCMFKCKGNICEEAFITSINKLIKMNESFHTIYGKKNGEYYQSILNNYNFLNEIYDFSNKSKEEIDYFIRECCNKPFNLFNEIPIRSYLIKVSENEYYWLINTHHIAADGWSVGIVCKEITSIYMNAVNNKPLDDIKEPKIQYVDYAYFEDKFMNSQEALKQIDFWRNYLKGISGITKMPTDKARPENQTFQGSTISFNLGRELTDLCKEYSKKHQISLFILLETIYAVTMYKLSGEEDICIGAPVANRKDKNAKNVVGFYANTIVIRNILNSKDTFLDNLLNNKEHILKAYDNVEVPFEEVVKNIKFKRNLAFAPVFQHLFTYQNYGMKKFEMKDVSVNIELLDFNAAKFDMSMTIFEDDNEISGLLEYNTDLYYKDTINKFIEMYKHLIGVCVKEDNVNLENIAINENIAISSGNNEEDYYFD